MNHVSIEDAQAHFSELIAALAPGEELVITQNEVPVATFSRTGGDRWPCKAGSAKDSILWMAPDFDAPLDEFREYMQ